MKIAKKKNKKSSKISENVSVSENGLSKKPKKVVKKKSVAKKSKPSKDSNLIRERTINYAIDEINDLMDSFVIYINSPENVNRYFICENSCNVFHVVKKVSLHVKEFNYNSVFQPYEKSDDRSYVISFLVKLVPINIDESYLNEKIDIFFSEEDREPYLRRHVDRLKNDLECETYTIRRKEDIGRILDGIKK